MCEVMLSVVFLPVTVISEIQGNIKQAQRNPSEELKVVFTKGYDITLRHIHRGGGFFTTAIGYCPPRKKFYEKLAANPGGEPSSQETLDKALNDWLSALDIIISRMDACYMKGKHGDVDFLAESVILAIRAISRTGYSADIVIELIHLPARAIRSLIISAATVLIVQSIERIGVAWTDIIAALLESEDNV
ncbi:uncharacterized protein EDB91DRAFT_1085172 [Suillus paluster]|uniref:uncharacterized protein n=1 Tax=Suillus paluster TaxID=48578 RepID=UPI001B85EA1E|nr:uncharacterized protein EDB91DRAFT_1085172 [Suillus paluster]KAG1731241.1 hypothetical protein EDB91DRAFT_1085172 [Suillus paluster]